MSIEQLKRKLTMPELMARYGYDFAKNGTRKCMFHEDKTPSFGIYNKGKWRFKCFNPSCRANRGGDEVDFIQLHDNCSRRDAMRKYENLCRR